MLYLRADGNNLQVRNKTSLELTLSSASPKLFLYT